MKNILFLTSGIYYDPTVIREQEKYSFLSKEYRGLIFSVAHKKEYQNYPIGGFVLRGIFIPESLRNIPMIRNILYSIFVIVKYFQYQFGGNRIDVVIACDPFKTGVLAFLIHKFSKAKYIIEVVGNPLKSFRYESEKTSLRTKVKNRVVKLMAPFILNRAHGVKVLYKEQLAFANTFLRRDNVFCFHDFVPIHLFGRGENKKYLLFIGHPWFLKGVDVVIKAFLKISANFPEHRLKIVGYCPDRRYFERLAGGCQRVEFHPPVPYDQTIELIKGCDVFVLPSRTEAMGRVLLEAMASGKPVVASDVDGIPSYVKNGYNGLLFRSEDVDDLADKLKMVLSDRGLSDTLARNAYDLVRKEYSEEQYLIKFTDMVRYVTRGRVQ